MLLSAVVLVGLFLCVRNPRRSAGFVRECVDWSYICTCRVLSSGVNLYMHVHALFVRLSFTRGVFNGCDAFNVSTCSGLQAGGAVQPSCTGSRGVAAHECTFPCVFSAGIVVRSHKWSRCKLWHWFKLCIVFSEDIDSTGGIVVCSFPMKRL